MGIFDIFGKKDVRAELTKRAPYSLKVGFHPYRLNANKDSVRLRIDLKNKTGEPLLTSVVVQVPKILGLDTMGLTQVREVRLGELEPDEEKSVAVDIYSNSKTKEGTYPVHITAISHYRNYAYVINSEKKKTSLRVV